jgi:hypothetical protein
MSGEMGPVFDDLRDVLDLLESKDGPSDEDGDADAPEEIASGQHQQVSSKIASKKFLEMALLR